MSEALPLAASGRIFEIVGLAGSLRRESLNRALLRAAAGSASPRLRITTHDLADLPFYNADVEAAGMPVAVSRLQEAVRSADGLLVATPEYNHGLPGVLKNAIDWLSRPSKGGVLGGKVAAIMGASTGTMGTVRSQAQLRLVLDATNTHTLLHPEVLVGQAQDKFDADGRLIHEPTRELLEIFLERFADLIARFNR